MLGLIELGAGCMAAEVAEAVEQIRACVPLSLKEAFGMELVHIPFQLEDGSARHSAGEVEIVGEADRIDLEVVERVLADVEAGLGIQVHRILLETAVGQRVMADDRKVTAAGQTVVVVGHMGLVAGRSLVELGQMVVEPGHTEEAFQYDGEGWLHHSPEHHYVLKHHSLARWRLEEIRRWPWKESATASQCTCGSHSQTECQHHRLLLVVRPSLP